MEEEQGEKQGDEGERERGRVLHAAGLCCMNHSSQFKHAQLFINPRKTVLMNTFSPDQEAEETSTWDLYPAFL